MKTFRQYEAGEIKRITAEHGCSAKDARECISALDWWKDIQKQLDDGRAMPLEVCRSVISNGQNLAWIAKTWPGSVPILVDLKTGLLRRDA